MVMDRRGKTPGHKFGCVKSSPQVQLVNSRLRPSWLHQINAAGDLSAPESNVHIDHHNNARHVGTNKKQKLRSINHEMGQDRLSTACMVLHSKMNCESSTKRWQSQFGTAHIITAQRTFAAMRTFDQLTQASMMEGVSTWKFAPT